MLSSNTPLSTSFTIDNLLSSNNVALVRTDVMADKINNIYDTNTIIFKHQVDNLDKIILDFDFNIQKSMEGYKSKCQQMRDDDVNIDLSHSLPTSDELMNIKLDVERNRIIQQSLVYNRKRINKKLVRQQTKIRSSERYDFRTQTTSYYGQRFKEKESEIITLLRRGLPLIRISEAVGIPYRSFLSPWASERYRLEALSGSYRFMKSAYVNVENTGRNPMLLDNFNYAQDVSDISDDDNVVEPL